MDYPNWFAHYAEKFFDRHLSPLAGKPGLRFLQIGAFTGDASLWLLDSVLTGKDSTLTDVDTWEGSGEPEHEPFDWSEVERVYDERMAGRRSSKFKGTSAEFFTASPDAAFDFIYIDGDHTAAGVLSDAVRAFDLLKPDGLLAFDDYQWKPYPDAPAHLAPGAAIDAFALCYRDRLEILEIGLQVWVQKIA
jgi:predicted O-methyltransferase YrrM